MYIEDSSSEKSEKKNQINPNPFGGGCGDPALKGFKTIKEALDALAVPFRPKPNPNSVFRTTRYDG